MLPLISEPYSFLQTFVYICVFASVAALVLVAVYFAVRKYRDFWISHRKLKYFICYLRDVILKIEVDLSNSK